MVKSPAGRRIAELKRLRKEGRLSKRQFRQMVSDENLSATSFRRRIAQGGTNPRKAAVAQAIRGAQQEAVTKQEFEQNQKVLIKQAPTINQDGIGSSIRRIDRKDSVSTNINSRNLATSQNNLPTRQEIVQRGKESFKGTFTKQEKPKLVSERIRLKSLQLAEQGKAGQVAAFGLSFGNALFGPVESLVRQPKQTVKSLFSAISNPKKTLRVATNEVKVAPATASGELVGAIFGPKLLTKSLPKKSPVVKFTAEEFTTKRITTSNLIKDSTQVNIKATVNKKPFSITGSATQEFTKVDKGLFGVKGSAKLTTKPKLTIETTSGKDIQIGGKPNVFIDSRGLARQQQGGVDVTSAVKVKTGKKTQNFVDVTQTGELIKEPKQVFRSFSRSGELITGKAITEAKPSRIGIGVTEELFIEDLRTGGNLLRKNVKTELGKPIATEQLLSTQRVTTSSAEFSKQFSLKPTQPDLSRTLLERKAFDVRAKSGTAQLITKSDQRLTLPKQQNIIKQAVVQQLKVESIKTSPFKPVNILKKTTPVSALTKTKNKQTADKTSLLPPVTKPNQIIKSSPITKPKERPVTKPVIKPNQKPTQNILPKTLPSQLFQPKQKIGVSTKPVVESLSSPKTQPLFTTGFVSFAPITPSKTGGGFLLPDVEKKEKKKKKGKKGKKKGTRTKRTPSVEAALFGIKGNISPIAIKSGLPTRPIEL